jgi:hypothetical protein
MADNWEDREDIASSAPPPPPPPPPSRIQFNPNAKAFTFNPSASNFAPSFVPPPPPRPTQPPPPEHALEAPFPDAMTTSSANVIVPDLPSSIQKMDTVASVDDSCKTHMDLSTSPQDIMDTDEPVALSTSDPIPSEPASLGKMTSKLCLQIATHRPSNFRF